MQKDSEAHSNVHSIHLQFIKQISGKLVGGQLGIVNPLVPREKEIVIFQFPTELLNLSKKIYIVVHKIEL